MLKLFLVSVLSVSFSMASEEYGLGSAIETLRSGTFCCAFYDAKNECHNRCQGMPCWERCESRCGITNTVCGSWPCQEVNSEGCTTTTPPPPPAPAPTVASCLASGTVCFENGALVGDSACCDGTTCTPITSGTTTIGYCLPTPA